MNRLRYKYLTILVFGLLLIPAYGHAYDFPAAYSDKINDPSANTVVIIDYLTSKALNSADARDDAQRARRVKENAATALYAEALATRIKLVERSKSKGLKDTAGALTGVLKDSRSVLQEEVLTNVSNIAERLNDIVSLEAGLADMEGSAILTSIPNGDSELVERDEDQDQDQDQEDVDVQEEGVE